MATNRTFLFIKNLFLKLIYILSPFYLFLIGIGLLYSDDLIFLPPTAGYQATDDLIYISSDNVNNAEGSNTIIAHLLYNPDAKYTVIYSHGNAVDISGLTHLQNDFFEHGYSIIIYDYSGYGLSEGLASEQQVYNDVQAVYDYLINERSLKSEQIISYGHSLGAAVATDLAFNKPVAALILENPFVTAFRVKTTYSLVPFDKFASIDKIDKINTPFFITHSRDDPVIPFWHGKELYEKASAPKSNYWIDEAGHAGITHTDSFWPALEKFVAELQPYLYSTYRYKNQ